MPLISHRGAAGLSDANTLDSIQKAAAYQPDFIEIDINVTSDNVIVIHHGSMSRFMRGKGTKESYRQLLEINPKLLTLPEFLDSCPPRAYIFDIKIDDEVLVASIHREITNSHLTDFSYTSPHKDALAVIKKASPEVMVFQNQPYHHGPVTAIEIARKHSFEGIALNKWWMTPPVYWLCKLHKKKLMCYTVDSLLGIWLVSSLFPDVYIVTNHPDRYRRLHPTVHA